MHIASTTPKTNRSLVYLVGGWLSHGDLALHLTSCALQQKVLRQEG